MPRRGVRQPHPGVGDGSFRLTGGPYEDRFHSGPAGGAHGKSATFRHHRSPDGALLVASRGPTGARWGVVRRIRSRTVYTTVAACVGLVAVLTGCGTEPAAPASAPHLPPTTFVPAVTAETATGSTGAPGHRTPATADQLPPPPSTTALRPMTSGEQQYRYGCLQGYITQGCESFTDEALLRAGIDPDS